MSDIIEKARKFIEESNASWAEKYYRIGLRWVDVDGAARLREETKTTLLEQKKTALPGDMPDSHRERIVKADPEWEESLREMVEVRTDANALKVMLRFIEMKNMEEASANANRRAEMRL